MAHGYIILSQACHHCGTHRFEVPLHPRAYSQVVCPRCRVSVARWREIARSNEAFPPPDRLETVLAALMGRGIREHRVVPSAWETDTG